MHNCETIGKTVIEICKDAIGRLKRDTKRSPNSVGEMRANQRSPYTEKHGRKLHRK